MALPAVVGFYRRHMQIALGSIGHGASQASEGVEDGGRETVIFIIGRKTNNKTAQLLADTQADWRTGAPDGQTDG